MAGSPKWKVFDANKKYMASCKEVEACALLMDLYGSGATIRYEHSHIVWVEGLDGKASDSYDHTAQICHTRLQKIHESYYAKVHGKDAR